MNFEEGYTFWEEARELAREAQSVATKASKASEEAELQQEEKLAALDVKYKAGMATLQEAHQIERQSVIDEMAAVHQRALEAMTELELRQRKVKTLAKPLADLLQEELKKN